MSFQLLYPINKDRYVWNYDSNRKIDIWGVWDSGYYLDIARNGYSAELSKKAETLNQANYAFYPLYPILMRLTTSLTHNYLLSGFLISNLTFLFASVFLYLLVKDEFDDLTAKNSLLFLYAFPTAFIFTSVYPEALLLMLTVSSFYFARKGKYLLAGILGGLSALTKGVGIVLFIPLITDLWGRAENIYIKLSNSIKLLLIPLGALVYMIYLKSLTGNLFAAIEIEKSWERQFGNPIKYLMDGFTSSLYQHRFTALFTTIIIFLAILLTRYLRPSYWIYSFLLIFIPLSTALTSMPRYSATIFPLYIFLGLIASKYKSLGTIVLIIFAVTQGMMLVFWVTGQDLLM